MKKIVTVVAAMVMAGSVSSALALSGKEIYDTKCFVCHATGVANAPKLGDAAAWAPRIAQGMDVLMQSAIDGKNNVMPPRGTCMECSDDDLKAAIEYMTSQSQ